MQHTACFTGHRPARLPWGYQENSCACAAVRGRLLRAVERAADEGYTRFLCGMAQGIDLMAGELVLELREKRPELMLVCAVPYRGQAERWPYAQAARHARLLDLADEIVFISDYYTAGCMQQRNRYMVDRSSRLIAVYDGVSVGGTSSTIRYARKKGLDIDLIPTTEENP